MDLVTKRDLEHTATRVETRLLRWMVPTLFAGMGLAAGISAGIGRL